MNVSTQYARQAQSLTATLLIALCVVAAGPAATAGAVAVTDDRSTDHANSPTSAPLAGSGTAQDPYEISNATELQSMSDDLDAHYVLVDDVDATGTESWEARSGFDPVGDSDSAFTGTFDGRNHTVRGLTIRRSGNDWTGLFGQIGTEGRVEHVRLIDASVRGSNIVGVLAGQVDGTVDDVAVSGSVEGQNFVGGLAGKLEAGATVTRTSANTAVDGGTYLGGLAGSSNGASVSAASATGDVAGSENLGGFVGTVSDGSLRDVYATGSVSGSNRVGGLVGSVTDSTLRRAYSTGSVDGETQVGGVAGSSDGGISDTYWNGETAATDAAVGRERGSGFDATELTTDEMTGQSATANMGGLDTSTFWAPTDEYPVLQSQVDAVSLSIPDQIIIDRPTTATASVTLADGRTVAVTGTADYDANQSHLSVDAGSVATSGTGPVEVTATVAGHSDSATVSVVTPPDISVDDAALRYDRVGSETAAPVDVTLTNDGGADGEFDALLSVNGTVEETRTVTVPGHSTRAVQFNWSAPATGTYSVAVNDTNLGDLTVVEEPETSVASVTTSENLLAVGNATTVEATLENAGDAAAGHTVELTANGETVATKEVVVPADGTTVSFDYPGDSTGEYDLAVGGASAGTLTVAEMGTASVDSASVPESVGAGESYEVTVTVANSGGLPLSTDVAYSVGGSSVATETVEVPADGTTVTFETTAPEDGDSVEHSVTAGDSEWTGSTSLDGDTSTAASDGGDGDSAGEESGDDSDSGGSDATETTAGDGAGFGVVAALCALLGIARLGRRSG
ncbi:GLUG motif-containing protein [Halosimplex sp. TS25]|uniref:GLUG motif-containing protein n=1 Tax=Halosimplex rarum TaxID=3396619 RepID=UPI0039EBED56